MVRNVAIPPSASVRGLVPRSARRKRRARKPEGGGEGWLWLAALIVARKYQRVPADPGWLNHVSMKGVNQLDRAAFVERFGPLFEHSPWVAEEAWSRPPVRRRRRAARGAPGGHVRRAARAPARAHPRAPRPRRQGRDRGLADRQLAARAGRGRARPPDARRVRGVHAHERRVPRALRLPARGLRARAHEGVDPAGRRRAARAHAGRGGARGAGGDREDRAAAARRNCCEDLLRQAARARAPDRRRRGVRLRGRRRGAGRQLRARLHRGRQLRRRRHRHDEELHPARGAAATTAPRWRGSWRSSAIASSRPTR